MQSVEVETFIPADAPITLLPNFWTSACETATRAGHILARKIIDEFCALERDQTPITEIDLISLKEIGLSRDRQRQASRMAMPSISLTPAAGVRMNLLINLQTELRDSLRGGLTEKPFSAHADLVRLVPIWFDGRISLIRIEVDMHLHLWDEQSRRRLVQSKLIRGDVSIPLDPQVEWSGIFSSTLGLDGQSFQSQAHTAREQWQMQNPGLGASYAGSAVAETGFILGEVDDSNRSVDLSMLQGFEQPAQPNQAYGDSLGHPLPSFNIEYFGADFENMRGSVQYSRDPSEYGSGPESMFPSINNSPALSAASGGLTGIAELFLTSRPASQASRRSLDSFDGA